MTGNKAMKLFLLLVGLAVSVEGQNVAPGCGKLDMMWNVKEHIKDGDPYLYDNDFFENDVTTITCYGGYIVPWIITDSVTSATMKCMFDDMKNVWSWVPWDEDEDVRNAFDEGWTFDKTQESWGSASHYVCQDCNVASGCNGGGTCDQFRKCSCPSGFIVKGAEAPRECFEQKCPQADVCMNGAYCDETWEGVTCYCTDGFKGDNCDEIKSPCEDNPCGPVPCTVVGGNDFECDCTGTGYHGQTCDIENAKCPGDSDCGNGGICRLNQDDLSKTFCKCPEGTTGLKCLEFTSDPCSDPNPCQNEGTCSRDQDDFTKHKCTCVEGSSGGNCEVKDPCSDNPCQNEGTCAPDQDDSTKHKCTCVGGSSGENCEVEAEIDDTESHAGDFNSATAKTFLNLIAAQVIVCLVF